MATKNSFISVLEQISLMNKNSVEIITKMSDAVSTTQSTVTVNLTEPDGTITSFQMPTVGYLKNEIDIANANIKKLANIQGDSSTIIIDGKSSKKVYSVDMNREPSPISSINPVTQFKSDINWFFESLMNPLLSINVDLVGKVDDKTRKVVSKRYIVKFEEDTSGNLTARGQTALDDFKSKFLNYNNIKINDFLTWYTNPTNLGVQMNINPDYNSDEQTFDLNYKTVNYHGLFSVIKMESDPINNKIWYYFDKITYMGVDGSVKSLAIGDELMLNNKSSMTRYKVKELNTASSLLRVAVETIEGYDPVPIGTSVLKYYSTLSTQKAVQITIGFDEYNVVFVKPINTDNNIIGTEWSDGFAFYTNDLTLDTDSNVSLANYYVESVFDYGSLLKDMVTKNIPSKYGVTPNTPVLDSNNFKVVQINKHLTDTQDSTQLKKLSSQKNTIKSKISQINDAITEKNKQLNTTVYKSIAAKTKSENELNKLIKQNESESKLLASVVSQLKSSLPSVSVTPIFRLRGFWNMPDPIIIEGYKNQEVIAFEIQYKKKAKSGQESATEGFDVVKNVEGSTVPIKKLGYYSNWTPIKTDIRKRYQDSITGEWKWQIEDISDADTPNINQLDIDINPNEAVDVRIRSISEVGYPDAPLMSEWSDVMTYVFPDELTDTVSSNDSLTRDTAQEEIMVQFDSNLSAKGVTRHVQASFYVNEAYYGHPDKEIATSFKDSLGNTLSLYDYLKLLNDKITALEEAIKRSKGELKVTLFKGTDEISITNNSVYNITINCDDYSLLATGATTNWFQKYYENHIYLIQDYYLQFENIAIDSDLILLADKKTTDINPTYGNATFVDENDSLDMQVNYQYIWIKDTDGTTPLYSGGTLGDSGGAANAAVMAVNDYNLGAPYSITSTPPPFRITNDVNWIYTPTIISEETKFLATVHPAVKLTTNGNELSVINDDQEKLINPTKNVKIPINIYYKLDGTASQDSYILIDASVQSIKRTKKLKFYLELDGKTFGFTIRFTLVRNNTTPQVSTAQKTINYYSGPGSQNS